MNTKLLVAAFALVVSFAGRGFTQTGPAPDQVVISIYGTEYTSAELENLRANLPEQFKTNIANMTNKAFLDNFGFLQALAKLARDEGVDKMEPVKTQLEFNLVNFLAQAYLGQINSRMRIEDKEIEAYYNANQAQFSDARVSAIAFDFSPIPELAAKEGKTVVTEQDAWGEANEVRAKIAGGADFAEMAKLHSDDAASAANGGDMGVIAPDDRSVSENIRQMLARMQPGQLSAPVKEGARYYLFKVTAADARPLEEVRPQILQMVQGAKLKERLDQIREDVKIIYDDPAYLSARPGN